MNWGKKQPDLKIFAGFVQAMINRGTYTQTATAALYLFRVSKAAAMADCEKTAFERYPQSQGYFNHLWDLAEVDGVTVPADKVQQ